MENLKNNSSGLFLLIISLALLTSCLGASGDIVMRADGSGSITLEYRVSQMLESMGRLDGNERWPAIPVGKADFERSIARIPGMKLSAFSVREAFNALGGKDLLTRVTLDFKDTASLLIFLDSSGANASLVQKDGKNVLRLTLADPSTDTIDEDLLSLLQGISDGYELSVSFTAPKAANLLLIPPSVPVTRFVPQGKKVSFAIAMSELVCLRDGLALEIRW